MIQNKHIIKSLPLLASALGRKYGVQVHIGGDAAYTNGKSIYLPTLPSDCSEVHVGLIRGYIDHESSHLRTTDFECLQRARLSPLEKHIWNILEDWLVEHKLTAVFPGCRQNIDWLLRHIFLDKQGAGEERVSGQPEELSLKSDATQLLNWLLLSVRAWDITELEPQRDSFRANIENTFPGLVSKLDLILQRVSVKAQSTKDCIVAAKRIVSELQKYLEENEATKGSLEGSTEQRKSSAQGEHKVEGLALNALQSLQNLLRSQADELPQDIGAILSQSLESLHQEAKIEGLHTVTVACPSGKSFLPLSPQEQAAAKMATVALKAKLQGLLQSSVLQRSHRGRRGKLDPSQLHRLSTGDAKIFQRKALRQGINTAVHILFDTSGSMTGSTGGGVGSPIELGCKACFAAASALYGVPGISLAVTAFPGEADVKYDGQGRSCCAPSHRPNHDQTVAPILKHNEKMHNLFKARACGNTPMDSAIWWALQEMQPLPQSRKIILLITDGEPDHRELALNAIKSAADLGFELYGIGITNAFISKLLPGRSEVIQSIEELPCALFGMLQRALCLKA